LLALAQASAQAVPGEDRAAERNIPGMPEPLTPEAIDPFVAQLTDAQARTLLIDQLRSEAAPAAPTTMSAAAESAMPSPGMLEMLRDRSAEIGQRLDDLGQALDSFSARYAEVLRNLTDQGGYPVVGHALLVFLAMMAIGVVAELLLRRAVHTALRRSGLTQGQTWSTRLGTLALRFAIDLLATITFSVVAYLASFAFFERYDPLRELVAALLLTIVWGRLGRDIATLVLAPRAPQLRLVAIGDAPARRLRLWITVLAAATGFAVYSRDLLAILGLEPRLLLIWTLLVGLLVMLLLAVAAVTLRGRAAPADPAAAPRSGTVAALLADTWHLFAIAYLAVVWCIWAVNLLLGQPAAGATALWSVIIIIAVVAADQLIFGMLNMAFTDRALAAGPRRPLRIARIAVRSISVLAAVLMLGDAWGLGLGAWLATPLGHTVAQAAFNIVVTVVLALIVWHMVRHFIDRQLARAEAARPTEGAAAQFGTRAETLLPLLRNFVLIVLLVMVTMIVLSSLGLDIGPLIAGAGIVGLAIGFGSQTLVKDIVSGVFFLIDDAFRVGEYVETGEKRGTVEAISLRSLRLRHHRGPLHTVPFGELQAVTNYSRGWVIEKMELNVTYTTDLDLVKKIIKQVSKEISQEEEFKKIILEPPKSQGVDRLADFSIVVRIKFKTLPGEQFLLRRELYKRLKRAFDANGINFAFPTVTIHQVGGSAGDIAQSPEVIEAAAAAAGVTKSPAPG
jgi:moderate conductance mechanosensitive channel